MLGKRLARFGLELHPDKTRLIDFRPPAERAGAETTLPTTFVFLGFLHVWGKSRKGNATMWQRTAKDGLARTLKGDQRAMPPHAALAVSRATSSPLPNAAGALLNSQRLAAVLHQARRLWREWLSRRSWKSYVTWAQFSRLVAVYPLPPPCIIHRYF